MLKILSKIGELFISKPSNSAVEMEIEEAVKMLLLKNDPTKCSLLVGDLFGHKVIASDTVRINITKSQLMSTKSLDYLSDLLYQNHLDIHRLHGNDDYTELTIKRV